MAVEIRPARDGDVQAVQVVARWAWHAAHAPIIGSEMVADFLAEHYDIDSIRDRVVNDDAIFPVAVADRELDGFALAGPTDADDGAFSLSQLYVAPDRWGEGIGGQLLDRVVGQVEAAGGTRIELAVMAKNERAVGFYESAGFQRTEAFHDDRIDADAYNYARHLD